MSSADCTHPMPPRQRSTLLGVLGWLRVQWLGYAAFRATAVVSVWLDRARQRRHLAQLSEHMLRDIGLTRVDAWAEAQKPFWRP